LTSCQKSIAILSNELMTLGELGPKPFKCFFFPSLKLIGLINQENKNEIDLTGKKIKRF